MKILNLTLLIFAIIIFGQINATESEDNIYKITKECNAERDGDKVIRLKIPFPKQIQGGDDILWDLSELKTTTQDAIKHRFIEGAMIKYDNREVDHHIINNDTLFRIGQNSPGKNIIYYRKEKLLRFPLEFRNSIGGFFYGEGNIDNTQELIQGGITMTEIIGRGRMITPDRDSVRNVLLVHYFRHGITSIIPSSSRTFSNTNDSTFLYPDTIMRRVGNDSITHSFESYKWFARGYRYPLIETRKIVTYYYGTAVDSVQASFYYPPFNQRNDLIADEKNIIERRADELEPFAPKHDNDHKENNGKNNELGFLNGKGSQCELSPTLINDYTTLSYKTMVGNPISIEIYSMSGQVVWKQDFIPDSDFGSIQFDLSSLAHGNYVVMVSIKDENFPFKIIKKTY